MSYSAPPASLIATLTTATEAFAQATEVTAIVRLLLELVQTQTTADRAVLVQPQGDAWQILGQLSGQIKHLEEQESHRPSGARDLARRLELVAPECPPDPEAITAEAITAEAITANMKPVLQQVRQTGQELQETISGSDGQPRTVLCLPLRSALRSALPSALSQVPTQVLTQPLLYLEAAGEALQPSELELIRFLCSQANLALARVKQTGVKQTGVKQTGEQPQPELRRMERVLEVVGAAIWERNLQTDGLAQSASWYAHLGYGAGQAPATHADWLALLHPEDRGRLQTANREFVMGLTPNYSQEYRIRCQDGTYRWVRSQAVLEQDATGLPLRVIGCDTDITAFKQAELALRASEMRYWEIVERQTDLICRLLPDGTLTFVNDAYSRYFRKTRQELIGQSFTFAIPLEDQAIVSQTLASLQPERRIIACEHRVWRHDGQVRWQRWTNQAIYDGDGNLLEVQSVGQDITERKLAEEELRRSELGYRAIVNAIPDLMLKVRRDGTCLDVIQPQEASSQRFMMLQRHLGEVLPADLLQQQLDYIDRAIRSGKLQVYEHQITKGDQVAFEEIRISPLSQDEVLILVRDISDRKRAEAALQQSEERFRSLVETSSDWIWEVNERGVYTYCSPRCQEILGYSPEQLIGKTPFDLMPPAEAARIGELFGVIAAQQQPFSCLENVNHHRDGHLVTLETSGRPLFDAAGQFRGYRGMDRDVTDRKQTEASLQSLVLGTAGVTGEEFFTALVSNFAVTLNVDHAAVSLYEAGAFRTLAFWSQGEMRPNLRYSTQEGAACYRVVQQGVYCCEQGAAQIFLDQNSLVQRLGADSYLGVALINSQGETIGNVCILDSKPLVASSRYLTLLQIFAARASAELERQMALDALQASETKLRGITDTVPGAVYQYYMTTSGEQGFDFISQGALSIYEITPEQITQDAQVLWNLLPPEDVVMLAESIQRSADRMERWVSEHRITTPSGQEKWLAAHAVPLAEADRIVWNGFLMDVTQRRQMEAALRQNELRLRQITDAIPGVVYQYRLGVDGEESFPFISQGVQELYGCSVAQVQQDPSHLWRDTHGEDVPFLRASILVSMETLEPWQVEYRVNRPDGGLRWISGKALPTRLPDGSTLWNGVLVEITELKLAQAALQTSETRYSMATRAAKVGVWDWNMQTNEFYLDPNVKAVLGYTDAEIPNDLAVWVNYVHPDDRERVMQLAQAHLDGELPEYTCEHRMYHKDGSIRWILVRGNVLRDPEGKPLRMMGTDTDITDRKQLEAEIQRKTTEMQAIFDAFPDLFFRLDRYSNILDYKAGAQEQLDTSSGSFLGRPMSCLLPPSVGQRFRMVVQQVLRNRQIVSLEYSLTVGTRTQDYEARIVPIQADQVVATIRNISDRKQAERALQQLNQELERRVSQRTQELVHMQTALRQSEEFLRSIYEGVQYPIFVIDVTEDQDFRQAGWNPACEKTTGQSSASVQGKRLREIIPEPTKLRETYEFFGRCVASGRVTMQEEKQTFQEQESWYLTTLNPLKDSEGKVYRIIGTAFNITDRKQAEEALQESEERFRQLAENAESTFWMIDSETRQILYVSPAYEQIWQRPVAELYESPMHWLKTVHPEDRLSLESTLDQQKQGGYDREYRILRPDGEIRWVRDRAFPVRNSAGQIYRIAGIAEDVSQRKQAEATLQRINSELENRVELRTAELRQAKEAAESANLAKSTFLANMSHELRTPLNAILGFSQLMTRDADLNTTHQQQLGIINRNGEHLLALINDILEMSKIEAGRATLNPNDFDLHRLLDTLMDMFQIKAKTKSLDLQLVRTVQVPQFIRTDESKLRQVLVNLLSNAIKFTASGRVTLRCDVELSSVEPNGIKLNGVELDGVEPSEVELMPQIALQFAVEDTGAGIQAAEMASLFEPFVQTETGRQSQEGTGLGLPISRQFVHLMGGELMVKSVLAQGSIFEFTIQCQRVEALTLRASQPSQQVLRLAPGQPSYRILVAEDNWANRQFLIELLVMLGFEVRSAQNGEEAIAHWREWSPHLIWMDIRMPVMDGYAATRQIRAEIAAQSTASQTAVGESGTAESSSAEGHALDTTIIALTASAFEEERVSILAAGCDDFVRKPVSETVLLEKMTQYLGAQYIYTEVTMPSQAPESTDLSHQQLDVMPSDWISHLHRAAQTADEELLLQLIDQIPSSHRQLASKLRDLVHNFCLEEIMAITSPETPESTA